MLMQCTVSKWCTNHSALPACISKKKKVPSCKPTKQQHFLLQEKPQGEAVVVTLAPTRASQMNTEHHCCANVPAHESLTRVTCMTDPGCEEETDWIGCTSVVVCEAHSHEVFGWAVVIHLVTSVSTQHFVRDDHCQN